MTRTEYVFVTINSTGDEIPTFSALFDLAAAQLADTIIISNFPFKEIITLFSPPSLLSR